jgi:hypothetical protein
MCEVSSEKLRVVYIAGMGRSGSTILGRLLGLNEGWFCAGELSEIWHRSLEPDWLCGCGTPLNKCQFWNSVFEDAFGGIDRVPRHAVARERSRFEHYRYIPLMFAAWGRRMLASRLATYVDAIEKLYRSIAAISRSRVIVDSSKFPSYGFVVLGLIPGIEPRLVHLVRDPRAVAYSWQRRKLRTDTNSEAYMPRMTPYRSSLRWSAENIGSEALRFPGTKRSLRLRYEDFVRAPERRRDEIFGLVGEAHSQAPQATGRFDLVRDHSVSGNPDRVNTGKVILREDDEWKTAMGRWQKLMVAATTWPLLLRYGYPLLATK